MSARSDRSLAAFLLIPCLFGAMARADELSSVEVTIPGADGEQPMDSALFEAWRQWLIDGEYGVDRCGQDAERGVLSLIVGDAAELEALREIGFSVREYSGEPLEGDVRTQSQYFDPDEIGQMLTDISSAHPTITRLFAVGISFEGRPIFGIEISDHPGMKEDEPAIQFNGQHHAREVATSHVPMDIVNFLVNGYGVDSAATAWVNNYKTVCIPMVNPDGVQFVFDGTSSWRKNRRFTTCFGVDLNRNYPYRWGPAGCGGSSPTCSSDIYRGPSAASEYETQAMMALADEWRFVMATSYHSFGQFIDYPYACYNGNVAEQMPEHAVIAQMMLGVRAGIIAAGGPAYAANTTASAGPLTGDDTSWYYAHKGCYPFIIEIGTSFEPTWTSVPPMINYLRGGWKYMYRRLGEARLDVHVRDACTGEPLEATVTLTNYVYDTGELARMTYMPYGRWTYIVMPNQIYTVRGSKPGYETQEVTVSVGNAPLTVLIELVSSAPRAGSTDCNANGTPDECDIASGTSDDCNADGTPDECQPDCNNNGMADDCETLPDCNLNNTPDTCDIASGTSNDCNANGGPDECDIAGGTSDDCNTDGTPDDCQAGLPAGPSQMVAALSRKLHAGIERDINIPLAGQACNEDLTTEPRNGGMTELRIGFDVQPGGPGPCPVSIYELTCADCTCPGCTGYRPYSGLSSLNISREGDELVLRFTPGLENGRTYRIALGASVTTLAGQALEVRVLHADVNEDGFVNGLDRSTVVGVWTGPGGFSTKTDINADGVTNGIDRSVVVGAWTGSENCAP